MQNVINLAMLVSAIAASLTFGVLAAHALCRLAFAALRMHASSIVHGKLEKVTAATP